MFPRTCLRQNLKFSHTFCIEDVHPRGRNAPVPTGSAVDPLRSQHPEISLFRYFWVSSTASWIPNRFLIFLPCFALSACLSCCLSKGAWKRILLNFYIPSEIFILFLWVQNSTWKRNSLWIFERIPPLSCASSMIEESDV